MGHPLGKRLYSLGGLAFEVIGVVGDARRDGLDQAAGPQVSSSARGSGSLPRPLDLGRYFAIRTDAGTGLRVSDLRAIVQHIEPRGTLENVATMEDIVGNSLARPRFYAVLFAVFSALALGLAAIGIFGVMAHSVARQTRDFGIRLAVGATRGDVMRLVLGQSARLIGTGMVVGVIGASILTRYLQGMLFELDPLDLSTFVATSTGFSLIALIAAWLPAHPASRVDPLIALHTE